MCLGHQSVHKLHKCWASCGWAEELCSQQSSLVGDWSRVLGSAQLISHVLGRRASKWEIFTTEQVQLGIGEMVQM